MRPVHRWPRRRRTRLPLRRPFLAPARRRRRLRATCRIICRSRRRRLCAASAARVRAPGRGSSAVLRVDIAHRANIARRHIPRSDIATALTRDGQASTVASSDNRHRHHSFIVYDYYGTSIIVIVHVGFSYSTTGRCVLTTQALKYCTATGSRYALARATASRRTSIECHVSNSERIERAQISAHVYRYSTTRQFYLAPRRSGLS